MDPLDDTTTADSAGPAATAATAATTAPAATSTAVTAGPSAPATTSTSAGELAVTRASSQDWGRIVVEWAAEEEWNPGLGDAECFHPADPGGFFIGRIDGRPVSAVSVVNYSQDYAFLGFYLVDPAFRGRGLGHATWRAAVPHAGDRVIGLDAVPQQEATYRRSGFTSAYRNIRYRGWSRDTARPEAAGDADTVRVTGDNLDALLEGVSGYDLRCFPSARRAFLTRWLTARGHGAYARIRGGRITGYGVIRAARNGFRIGPLFADTPADAGALLDALIDTLSTHAAGGTSSTGGGGTAGREPVWIDIPEPHAAAHTLAASRGFTEDSYTVRMYNGPAPATDAERVFASTTLELG